MSVPLSAAGSVGAGTGPAGTCPECGNALGGHYCANCGQEAELKLPSFGEFIREFIGDQVALEGKLLRSLAVLVRWPGRLTAEYVAGRRQRYVRPLRLYLSLSLVFFLVLGLSSKPVFEVQSSSPASTPKAAAAGDAGTAPSDKTAPQASAKAKTDDGDDLNVVFKADDDDSTGSQYLDDKIHRFSKLPEAEKSKALTDSLEHGAPYAIFVLMPLFAAGLKLLYLGSGRTYGEHFLFSLHAQSFAWLALLVGRIGDIPWLHSLSGAVNFAAVMAMMIYLYLAMRRFYGSGRWGTAWRISLQLSAYGVALILALTASTLAAVVTE